MEVYKVPEKNTRGIETRETEASLNHKARDMIERFLGAMVSSQSRLKRVSV